ISLLSSCRAHKGVRNTGNFEPAHYIRSGKLRQDQLLPADCQTQYSILLCGGSSASRFVRQKEPGLSGVTALRTLSRIAFQQPAADRQTGQGPRRDIYRSDMVFGASCYIKNSETIVLRLDFEMTSLKSHNLETAPKPTLPLRRQIENEAQPFLFYIVRVE